MLQRDVASTHTLPPSHYLPSLTHSLPLYLVYAPYALSYSLVFLLTIP